MRTLEIRSIRSVLELHVRSVEELVRGGVALPPVVGPSGS